MRIKKVAIYNFGPFYGEHEISFSEEGTGVHIIRGGNGLGKTSLQRAILWALYGRVLDRKGQEIRLTSLLNHTACKRDIYSFYVRIFFNHEGSDWSISRKMEASRHNDKKYLKGMVISVVKDGEVVSNPEHAILRILPNEVSRFYFFDAEMLRDYEELLEGDSHSITILKDSIERVLGVPHLKIARDDLSAIQKRLEKERTRLLRRIGNKDSEQLGEQLNSVIDEIESEEKLIRRLENQKNNLENEISEKKRELVDLKEVKELAEQRIQIDRNIELLETQKDTEFGKIRNLVSGLYKTILIPVAKNLILPLEIKSREALDKYDRKQHALARAKMLEKIITTGSCDICGTKLDRTKLHRLENELADTRIQIELNTEVPEPNLEFDHHKNRLENMISQEINRNEFKKIYEEIDKLDYELVQLRTELSDVQERLIGIDEEEPRRLEIEIQNMMKESGRLEEAIKTEYRKLEDMKSRKGELENKLASIPQEELDILGNRIEFAQSIAEVFRDAVTIYRDERKKDVEQIATEVFREIRSKEEFDHLEINEQFGLSIITTKGTVLNRSEWRSSGEEQLVALALVGALNKCAQVRAPVFMDTPFGRLDIKHGERVLRYLPNLADQVVLLVTSREFRKGDERFLEGHIKSDQTLHYLNETEGSIIVLSSSEVMHGE